MRIAAKTDVGRVRKSNQDAYLTGELPGGVAWAVVCDGMGGAAGGNIASAMAVEYIASKLNACFHEGMGVQSIENVLESAITGANICVYDMAHSNEKLDGMGTTVVAAVIIDGVACIAHAGDSRAYLVSGDTIKQVTTDHSLVQEMVDNGEITADEAKTHPIKNYITRALGTSQNIEIDFSTESLSEGDSLILCTDGLTNFVDDAQLLASTRDTKCFEFIENLVDMANENGGGDNITVVCMSV